MRTKGAKDKRKRAPLSEEQKAKISEGMKRAYAEGRRVISEEQREALRQSMLGCNYVRTPEMIAKQKATRIRNRKLKEEKGAPYAERN